MNDLRDNSDDFINRVNQEQDQSISDLIGNVATNEAFIKRRVEFRENLSKRYSAVGVDIYDESDENIKKYDIMFDSINEDYRAFLTDLAEVLGPEKFKKIFDLEVNQISEFAFPKLGTF
jgi:hypothetical protein